MEINETQLGEQTLIVIDNGILKLTLSTFGASLYSLIFNNEEMLLTPKKIEEFLVDNYYGKTIGRINNRVEGGLVAVEGRSYYLPKNEGENTYNSGSEGLHKENFAYRIESNNLETKIIFSFLSREDKNSLPGDVYLNVTYLVKENDNKFTIKLDALSNKDTPLGFSNHIFFSLGSQGLEDKRLQIKASKFIHTKRENLIPLYVVDIPSCINYLDLKPVLFDINNLFLQDHAAYGLNHNYVFDKVSLQKDNLIFENHKYSLKLYTDYECVHISSCNYPDGIEKITGENIRYEGLLIEPEENIKDRKIGKEFHHQTIYSFEKK